MKILGIVGSPRKGGNTEILVNEALKAAAEHGAEVEMMTLAGKIISPCDDCKYHVKWGKCHIEDDMQEFYPKLLEANGIIFGTPVYFWGVSGQMKAFIDRTSPLAMAHRAAMKDQEIISGPRVEGLRDKVGGIVVVTRRAGATSAYSQMRSFVKIHNMIEVGGAIGYGNDKGDVLKDDQGMREAKYMGRAIVRAIQKRAG